MPMSVCVFVCSCVFVCMSMYVPPLPLARVTYRAGRFLIGLLAMRQGGRALPPVRHPGVNSQGEALRFKGSLFTLGPAAPGGGPTD